MVKISDDCNSRSEINSIAQLDIAKSFGEPDKYLSKGSC